MVVDGTAAGIDCLYRHLWEGQEVKREAATRVWPDPFLALKPGRRWAVTRAPCLPRPPASGGRSQPRVRTWSHGVWCTRCTAGPALKAFHVGSPWAPDIPMRDAMFGLPLPHFSK